MGASLASSFLWPLRAGTATAAVALGRSSALGLAGSAWLYSSLSAPSPPPSTRARASTPAQSGVRHARVSLLCIPHAPHLQS